MNVGRVDFEGALNQLADLEKSFNMELASCEKLAPEHLVSNFRDGRQNYLQVEKKNGKYCRRGITSGLSDSTGGILSVCSHGGRPSKADGTGNAAGKRNS